MTSSCKLPWHLWHWVQSLANFSSKPDWVQISFWYSSDSLGLQWLQTAPFASLSDKHVLQLRQVSFFLVNMARPPIFEIVTDFVKVCSPSIWQRRLNQKSLKNQAWLQWRVLDLFIVNYRTIVLGCPSVRP
jgi:hypothetical protein